MPTKHFNEVFQILKEKFKDLSLEEISLNTGIDIVYLNILFDPKNENLLKDISKLIEFANISVFYRDYRFHVYSLTHYGNKIKIARKIKPKVTMYYSRATNEFYDFKVIKPSINYISEPNKLIYQSEMKEFLEKSL